MDFANEICFSNYLVLIYVDHCDKWQRIVILQKQTDEKDYYTRRGNFGLFKHNSTVIMSNLI